MGVPPALGETPRPAPSNKILASRLPAFLFLVFLEVGCRQKKAPTVQTIAGESVVLPRVARATPAATRASPRTLKVGSVERRWVVVEPAVPAGRPLPLILVFHGDGGDAAGFHTAWPFERVTGADAILAYPEGLRRTWDLETLEGNKDERFVEALLAEVQASHAIDPARIFATGYSSGGFFTNVLACRHPGLFRGIASNAGGAPYNREEKWPNGYPKCPGQKPVAMLALHGEQDHGVTLDSGRFSAEYWAYVNGCKTDEMETTGYAECRVYRGCMPGKAVGFCSVPPLGHWVWDEAAAASWTFFERL